MILDHDPGKFRGGKIAPPFLNFFNYKKMRKLNNRFIQQFAKTNVKPAHNTNGFLPGSNTGLNVSQIRKAVGELPRCLGVKFTTQVGSTSVQNINLPGDCRLFLGIVFLTKADPLDQFTLTINNNLIIQSGSVVAHSLEPALIDSQYYEYPQPLSGKDTIELVYTSSVGNTNNIVEFHYI